jgi:hypothetical protein
MRGLAVACLLAGCASGRNAVWRDGSIEALPDALVVVAPDATPMMVCNDQQLLANPVLDLNPTGMGWVQINIDNTAPVITDYDGIAEHSPPFKAWLGGFEAYDYGVPSVTDQLYQDVAIPMNTTALRLTGQYAVGTVEVEGVAYDTAQLAITQTDGTPIQVIQSLDNLTPAAAWTAIDTTITSNLSGQTVRVRVTSTNDIVDHTNFYFDTLALTATVCQ